VSLHPGNKPPVRIRVRQDGEWVGAALGIPTLSSAQPQWRDALLERHIHGPCVSCTEWLSCNWPHCEIGEMKVKGIDEQHEYK
jgi:hypothetical protein